MSVLVWIGVVLIGGAGSVLRFVVDGAVASRRGRDFPYGTMVINLSGAMILGLITGLALGSDEALLAGTAAVGSYTTFSTWMFETERLTEEREVKSAVLNVVLSVVLGVAAAAAVKFCWLSGSTTLLTLTTGLLAGPAAVLAVAVMGWPQLVTAFCGGMIAFTVLRPARRR